MKDPIGKYTVDWDEYECLIQDRVIRGCSFGADSNTNFSISSVQRETYDIEWDGKRTLGFRIVRYK